MRGPSRIPVGKESDDSMGDLGKAWASEWRSTETADPEGEEGQQMKWLGGWLRATRRTCSTPARAGIPRDGRKVRRLSSRVQTPKRRLPSAGEGRGREKEWRRAGAWGWRRGKLTSRKVALRFVHVDSTTKSVWGSRVSYKKKIC